MDKILIVTPIQRTVDGRPVTFSRAMHSLYGLRFAGHVDYYSPSAMDTPPANQSINAKYQQAHTLALSGGYDALLCAESDMMLPIDALEKLAEVNADVCYGLYIFRHGKKQWSAFTDLQVDTGKPLSDTPERARSIFGQVIQVAGIGLGCTLIRREVLEAVPFDCREHGYTDWLFAQNVAAAGGEQVCHTGVVCGHIHKDQILYPDINEPELYRIEAL